MAVELLDGALRGVIWFRGISKECIRIPNEMSLTGICIVISDSWVPLGDFGIIRPYFGDFPPKRQYHDRIRVSNGIWKIWW